MHNAFAPHDANGFLERGAIARAVGVSNSTVSGLFARTELTGLTWPLPEGITDAVLEQRLYRDRYQPVGDPRELDWARVHEELRARKHVTLRLVWRGHREAHPDGYSYSWFAERYRARRRRIDVVMRCHHKAGEKPFVDWAGDIMPYVDPQTGEVREAHLFLAVPGFSSYTFARAYAGERTESFLDAHVRAVAHLGGAPELLVPDNLKTGVKRADRYEAELAAHYDCVALPARVGKPRDKAKAECALERLAVPVLPGLAGCEMEGLGAGLLEPVDELGGDELTAVVRSHDGGRAMLREQLGEHALDGTDGDRVRSLDGERDTGVLVDDGEDLHRAP